MDIQDKLDYLQRKIVLNGIETTDFVEVAKYFLTNVNEFTDDNAMQTWLDSEKASEKQQQILKLETDLAKLKNG